MDVLVSQIRALSDRPGDLSSLNGTLKSPQTEAVLHAHAGALLPAVSSLDAAQHSLGCLYLLDARGSSNTTAQQQVTDREFLDAAARFLLAATPAQVRLAPAKFVSLCHHVRAHAMAQRLPKLAVLPLLKAVDKLCPTPDHLSPVHPDACQLALLSKTYSSATTLLSADLLIADPNATTLGPTDVLLTCYYGAMLAIGRRQYSQAQQLLLTALTVPTMVLSAVTLACLKKWLLVGLLLKGEVLALPRWAPGVVSRALRADCGLYQELARQCRQQQSKTSPDLATWARGKQQDFEQDGNAGLLRLVMEGALQRRLAALTRTFATLGLQDAAKKLGLGSPQEAELLVLRCIDSGPVQAAISERQSVVRFQGAWRRAPVAHDLPDLGCTTGQVDRLISQAVSLAQQLQAADHAVTCTQAYVAKAEIRSAGARSGPSHTAAVPAPAAAEPVEPSLGGGSSEADLLPSQI